MPDDPEPLTLHCPHCEGAIEVVAGLVPESIACPHCEGLVIVPAIDGSTQIDVVPDIAEKHETDLNGIRIRQITQMRRAAIRSRTYFLVGTFFTLVAALQFLWLAVLRMRAGQGERAGGYLMLAGVSAGLCWYCFGRSEGYRREAEVTALPEPQTPPDFEPLSDGSQQWKRLEGSEQREAE